VISRGNAGKMKGSRRRRGDPYRPQTTVIIGGPAAAATDYTNPGGPRFPIPALAEPLPPSRGTALEKQKSRTSGRTVQRTSCPIYAALL